MEDQNQPLDAGMASGASDQGLVITEAVRNDLTEIAKWAMFFAVLLFIILGLVAFAALAIAVAGGIGGIVAAIFVAGIYGVLLFFPAWYYYKFATLTRQAVSLDDNTMLDEGFLYLKRFYRFVGILVVVILSLYALFLLIGISMMGRSLGSF